MGWSLPSSACPVGMRRRCYRPSRHSSISPHHRQRKVCFSPPLPSLSLSHTHSHMVFLLPHISTYCTCTVLPAGMILLFNLQIQLLTISLNWWKNLLNHQTNAWATWPLFFFRTVVAVTPRAQWAWQKWVEFRGKPLRDDRALKVKVHNNFSFCKQVQVTAAKHMKQSLSIHCISMY